MSAESVRPAPLPEFEPSGSDWCGLPLLAKFQYGFWWAALEKPGCAGGAYAGPCATREAAERALCELLTWVAGAAARGG
jgi:hypothetical protein